MTGVSYNAGLYWPLHSTYKKISVSHFVFYFCRIWSTFITMKWLNKININIHNMMNALIVSTQQSSYHARLLAGGIHSETLVHRHCPHAGEHTWKRCGKEQLATPSFKCFTWLDTDILKVMSLILHILVVICKDEQNKHHVTFMVPKIVSSLCILVRLSRLKLYDYVKLYDFFYSWLKSYQITTYFQRCQERMLAIFLNLDCLNVTSQFCYYTWTKSKLQYLLLKMSSWLYMLFCSLFCRIMWMFRVRSFW